MLLESHADFSVQSQLADAMKIVALAREGSFQHRIHLRIAEMPIDSLERFDVVGPHEVNPGLAIAAGLVHDLLVVVRRTNLDFIRKDHEGLAVDGLGVLPVVVDYLAGAIRPLAEGGAGVADDDVNLVETSPEANMCYGYSFATPALTCLDGHGERIAVCNIVLFIDGGLDVVDGRTDANDVASGVA